MAEQVASRAGDPGASLEGDRFGRFRLIERIGQGGMAEVFRAVSHGLEGFERVFVIKRIRPDRSDSAKFVQMFCDEARISALLHHPNIVQVYDFGQIDGAYFMAMEYLRGKDLASVLRALRPRRGALAASVAALVTREVARALHHAHTVVMPGGEPSGIVHRDVTPSNIMLLWAGGVKILDFGIAKVAAQARAPEAGGRSTKVQGKLAYLSPEQVRGAEVDHRSDIFSLGIVLWEMVAGQRLFPGDNEFETMRNVLMKPIPAPSLRRAGIPAVLDAIVARALVREPAARYQTAGMMADELDRFLVEAPCADQTIPQMLQEIFGAEHGGADGVPDVVSSTFSMSGPAPSLNTRITTGAGTPGDVPSADAVSRDPSAAAAPMAAADVAPTAPRSESGSATGSAGTEPLPELGAPAETASSSTTSEAGGTTALDRAPFGGGLMAVLGQPSRQTLLRWGALTAVVLGAIGAVITIVGWLAWS